MNMRTSAVVVGALVLLAAGLIGGYLIRVPERITSTVTQTSVSPITVRETAFSIVTTTETLEAPVTTVTKVPFTVTTVPTTTRTGPQLKAGRITSDETWSGEILVTDTVEVARGVTLTIEPGTTVKFKHYRGYRGPGRNSLFVMGTLRAVGTPGEPIWFTSDADDPTNGDWSMIRFEEASDETIVKYAIIEFGQQGLNLWHSSFTISHCIVRWNNWEGIYLESYCVPIIEHCMIYENGYNGVAMEQFNTATLRYNTIMRSGTHGIHVDASHATIEHNVVTENGASGVSVDNNGQIEVTYNTLTKNNDAGIGGGEGQNTVKAFFNNITENNLGIYCPQYLTLTANNNNIYGNTHLEFNVENSHINANAKNNWWGTTDEEAVRNQIRDLNGVVDIKPLLPSKTTKNPDTGEDITSDIDYDYEDLRRAELGYRPGDPEKDRYLYIYPDDETRRTINKIGKGLGLTWSVTWDGEHIWTATLWGTVYQIEPTTGEVLKTFQLPLPQPWGMTWDGEHLWINDFAEIKIYEVDPEDGAIISSFQIPGLTGGCKGLTWDGQHLYTLGWATPNIYKFDRTGNLIKTITMKDGIGGGLAWDGECFWAPGRRGICKIDTSGTIVGEIYAASEGTWDMTWDGTYLWATQRTNENWLDDKIFQLEILEMLPPTP